MSYQNHTYPTAGLLRKIDKHLSRASEEIDLAPRHEALAWILEQARDNLASLDRRLIEAKR